MEGLFSFVLKGQRKETWFPPSFQDAALLWDFQPLRGWLISIVASRQKMVSTEHRGGCAPQNPTALSRV